MIRRPLNVLVCLAIMSTLAAAPDSWGYKRTGVPDNTGIQGDALSADPSVQPLPPVRTGDGSITSRRSTPPVYSRQFPSNRPTVSSRSKRVINPRGPERGAAEVIATPNLSAGYVGLPMNQAPAPTADLLAGCPVQASARPGLLGEMFGPFSPAGIGLGAPRCVPGLPRLGWRQFQAEARVWYPQLNGSTIQWGVVWPYGFSGTQLDLHKDLRLRKHEYVMELDARYQFRPNWGLRYSFMPIRYKDNFTNNQWFWFGNLLWEPGWPLLTQWERDIHRFELVYDWFQQSYATSSIFAGYALHDDKLQLNWHNPVLAATGWSRIRSQNMHLATAGMTLDRVISQVGHQGIASVHCKWSVQFLEGYFGWDGYAGGRIAIPYCGGRFGYLEGGWRWIVLDRGMPSNTDKTNLEGPMGTVGLVF